jgi:adenylate cyclase
LSDASAVDCINEYLEQHCNVAIRYGATIDKYLGDGVMIRFNVPHRIDSEDHAMRAVEAAVEMREAFGRLKEGWLKGDLPVSRVFCRIGLSCGPVYEARIGHPQFQQLTVIGNTVNHAASLCEAAPRDRDVILIDDAVARRVQQRFTLTSEGLGSNAHEVVDRA